MALYDGETQFAGNLEGDIAKEMANYGFIWSTKWLSRILKSLLEGTAEYLSSVKGSIPQVVVIRDDNGKPIFAAMVEKVDNEETGGYTLSYFYVENENDIPADAKVVNIDNGLMVSILNDISFRSYGFTFATEGKTGINYIRPTAFLLLNAIKKNMINNVHIDKVLDIIDYIALEAEESKDGKVHIKITPNEKLKQHIKDDVDVSVA